MKKLLLSLVLLTTITISNGQAQKGADKIIIRNDKSASDNFMAVKLVLAEKGIEIASQDKDIYQLKTGIIPISRYGAGAYYVLLCSENKIQLTGYFNTGLELNALVKDTDPFKRIVNRNLGLYGEAWRAMNALALQLGNDVTYTGTFVKQEPKKDDVY
jgi:hypothetical protein